MESIDPKSLRLRPIQTKRVASKVPQSGEISLAERLIEPMSPIGRLFSEATFNYHVLAIIGFKNPIDVEAFRDDIENTFAKHKRFSSIVRRNKNGGLQWVRTQVRIQDHYIVPVLDQLASETSSLTFVEDYAASLMHAPPLDPSRPLWQIHVLN
eukprot:c40426_g1_i1 orf=1-459(-)